MRRILRATGPPLFLAGWAYVVLLFTPATATIRPPTPRFAPPSAASVPKTVPPFGSPASAQASYAEPLDVSISPSSDTTDLCEVSCRINCRPLVALSAPWVGSSLAHLG